MLPFEKAGADNQSSFIIDLTHAFYAKSSCTGVDIVYEDFVKAAKAKNLNVGIVEEVRKGVAFLNTNGQMGHRLRKSESICRTGNQRPRYGNPSSARFVSPLL